jgi:long-chain fatty acid transport protein
MAGHKLLFTCAAFTAVAVAQGLNGNGFSARSLAMGGTFQDGDATMAMAVNPAGLALIGSRTAEFHLMTAFGQGSFRNSANADGSLRPLLGAIPYGAIALPIGKSRVTVGGAFLPETALASRWSYVDAPGTAGASWGRLDHRSQILAARSAFGIGVYLGPKLAIGATLGAVYNRNRLDTAYIFQLHPALRGLKTRLDLETSGVGWNGTFGVIYQPVRSLGISVAYKTRTAIPTNGVAEGTLDRQFEAAGLNARPDYRYDARVDNTLPQSVAAAANWRVNPRLKLIGQLDWVNWSGAFRTLPVTLTRGNNADINGLLGEDVIRDGVPLDWRDQFVMRAAVETPLSDNLWFRAGTFFTQNPVPRSTLTPLTGAIMKSAVSTGLGWRKGAWTADFGYAFNPPVTASVGQSALAAGEYSNSRVRLTVHSLLFSAGYRF